MPRLFLFAIGGTGARVLRALTHVLAAGARLQDANGAPMELVPLVIDPDADNGDTLDCLSTLGTYTEVRNRYLDASYEGSYFQTRISRYQELQADTSAERASTATKERESFRCGIVDRERAQTFAEVIGYDHLPSKTKLFVNALYSHENLDTRLSGGFLGNPNLGTVVLNKVKTSDQFRMLPGLFHDEDRVFVISSIFGGTGASGFPVLVKLLRDAKDENGNEMTVLRKAPIGALTVLPYFSVAPDVASPIDSNAFVPKTKAALAYYAKHLGGIQALFYVGDKARKQYRNTPTGTSQSNQDHVVEFIGASAVLNFATMPFDPSISRPARFFECATADANGKSFNLSSFGGELAARVGGPLTEFALGTRFLQQTTQPSTLPRLLAQPWTKEGKFDRNFFSAQPGAAYTAIDRFAQLWWAWLNNMGSNEPSFMPFHDTLGTLRRDREPTSLTTNAMNKALNLLDGSSFGEPKSVRRFLHMLSSASQQLCQDAYATVA